MTTKKLTPRQTKWAEFLSEFNFVVTYQTGKKNNKANALTRKPNKRFANDEDDQQKHKMQTLLPPERIEMHFIEVTDQLEKGCESKQPKIRNQSEQQKSVENQTERKKTGRISDLA